MFNRQTILDPMKKWTTSQKVFCEKLFSPNLILLFNVFDSLKNRYEDGYKNQFKNRYSRFNDRQIQKQLTLSWLRDKIANIDVFYVLISSNLSKNEMVVVGSRRMFAAFDFRKCEFIIIHRNTDDDELLLSSLIYKLRAVQFLPIVDKKCTYMCSFIYF